MKIRCPKCSRMFEFDPSVGPGPCPEHDPACPLDKLRPEAAGVAQAAVQSDSEVAAVSSEGADNQSNAIPSSAGQLVRKQTSAPVHNAHQLTHKDSYGHTPRVTFIRCPNCTARVPDGSETCPACGFDLETHWKDSSSKGIRAIFDVSGDVTFTPWMIVVLFTITLGAFLTFTYILTHNAERKDPFAQMKTISQGAQFDGGVQGRSFSQIKVEFLDPTNTEFREDTLREKYIGQRVIWNGLLKEVRKDEGGDGEVDVVMEDAKSSSFVTLKLLELDKNNELLGQLSRGQYLMFSGRIDDFDTGGSTSGFNYFRVLLRDGIILQ